MRKLQAFARAQSSPGRRCVQLVVLALCALTASAHHSHAEFSDELQTIEGELVSLSWRNPHPSMDLRVGSGDRVLTWTVQVLGNINGLRRNGISGDIFRIGERVSVTGQASQRRPGLLLGTQVRFPDGSLAVIGPDESTGQAIYRGRLAGTTGDPGLRSAAVAEQPQGIFRVWLVADRFRNPDLPLRPEARTAKDAWDSVTDDPQIGCQPLGMPGAMMSPHPIQFLQQGADIVLRLEEWDATRTIYLGTQGGSSLPSRMGHSIGRWEADALYVTTTNIDYPFMDEHGTPQSAAVEVVERFTLSADERSLDYEAIVTDPGTLTAPVVAFTTRWEWVPGESIQSYDCADLALSAEAAAGLAR